MNNDLPLDDPIDCIIYGPSTQNKIERWWRELHHRMEKFFKEELKKLVENGHYDPHAEQDRSVNLCYVVKLLSNLS